MKIIIANKQKTVSKARQHPTNWVEGSMRMNVDDMVMEESCLTKYSTE